MGEAEAMDVVVPDDAAAIEASGALAPVPDGDGNAMTAQPSLPEVGPSGATPAGRAAGKGRPRLVSLLELDTGPKRALDASND